MFSARQEKKESKSTQNEFVLISKSVTVDEKASYDIAMPKVIVGKFLYCLSKGKLKKYDFDTLMLVDEITLPERMHDDTGSKMPWSWISVVSNKIITLSTSFYDYAETICIDPDTLEILATLPHVKIESSSKVYSHPSLFSVLCSNQSISSGIYALDFDLENKKMNFELVAENYQTQHGGSKVISSYTTSFQNIFIKNKLILVKMTPEYQLRDGRRITHKEVVKHEGYRISFLSSEGIETLVPRNVTQAAITLERWNLVDGKFQFEMACRVNIPNNEDVCSPTLLLLPNGQFIISAIPQGMHGKPRYHQLWDADKMQCIKDLTTLGYDFAASTNLTDVIVTKVDDKQVSFLDKMNLEAKVKQLSFLNKMTGDAKQSDVEVPQKTDFIKKLTNNLFFAYGDHKIHHVIQVVAKKKFTDAVHDGMKAVVKQDCPDAIVSLITDFATTSQTTPFFKTGHDNVLKS